MEKNASDRVEKFPSRKTPRGIRIIAVWLILSTLPGIYWSLQLGHEIVLSRWATVLWGYNVSALLCAVGLLCKQEWARFATVWLFSLYFIWCVFVVHVLIGPDLIPFATWLAECFHFTVGAQQAILVFVLLSYIIWPVAVVFYMTYPGIKIHFQIPKR